MCEKATVVGNALARNMPNIGGPHQIRRKLPTSATNSVLLYEAPVWGRLIKNDIMSLFRRSCLQICCGYRTISLKAASVIAEIIQVDNTY